MQRPAHHYGTVKPDRASCGPPKGLAEILRAAIGVKNSSGFECVVTGGHAQRVDDQLSAHVIDERVPDAFLRAAVNDRGQVSEALPGREGLLH
jgi:hypothetical protein